MNLTDGKTVQWRGSNRELAVRIQGKLEEIVRESGTTAVCAAVCAEGQLLAAACAGTRGFEESGAEVDDLYNIGSVSKIYVTASIMKLVQEGKLVLDNPVTRYLPEWKLADQRFSNITLRMLLNHSSGIPGTNLRDALDMDYKGVLFTGKYRNTPEYWRTVKLRARPGIFSSYSNDGFDLLAEVVEAVTGKPYIEWLREKVAKPAGLYSTGAGRWGLDDRVKVSCKGSRPEFYNCFGAGAIHTTVPECAMFGYLFIDSRGIVDQAYLDETRYPQGKSFLKGAEDAVNYCLGWDSLYNRNKIPLGEGAVIKDGGTEQFVSFLLVGPAKGLSLAIAATSDSDVWWLEVLEEIGKEALRALGRYEMPDSEAGERENSVGEQIVPQPKAAGIQQEKQTDAAGEQMSQMPEIVRRYSGIAYGSSQIYRFSVSGDKLLTECYGKNGSWEKEESLSGYRWNGSCFSKGGNDELLAEEYEENVYYIRWGVAFCQKNHSYPLPGKIWPGMVGAAFSAGSEKRNRKQEGLLGNVCLREINEDNVLIFTTDHEDYQVVPLVCDIQKENETCLISETDRDGIVFLLERDEDGIWLRMGTDRYKKTETGDKAQAGSV